MEPDLGLLTEALRERLAIIADHAHRDRDAAAHLQRLVDISARIDSLISALMQEQLDPELRHYLEKCSYDKALARIESTPGYDAKASVKSGD